MGRCTGSRPFLAAGCRTHAAGYALPHTLKKATSSTLPPAGPREEVDLPPPVPAWIRGLKEINATPRPVVNVVPLWQHGEEVDAPIADADNVPVEEAAASDQREQPQVVQATAPEPLVLEAAEEEGPLAGTLSVLSRMATEDQQLAAAVASLRRLNRPPPPVPAAPVAANAVSDWDEGALDPTWTVEGRGVRCDTALGLLYSVPYLQPQAATARSPVVAAPQVPVAADAADDAVMDEDAAAPVAAGMRVESASVRVGTAVNALLRYAGDDVVLGGKGGRSRRLAATGQGGGGDGLQWVRWLPLHAEAVYCAFAFCG